MDFTALAAGRSPQPGKLAGEPVTLYAKTTDQILQGFPFNPDPVSEPVQAIVTARQRSHLHLDGIAREGEGRLLAGVYDDPQEVFCVCLVR